MKLKDLAMSEDYPGHRSEQNVSNVFRLGSINKCQILCQNVPSIFVVIVSSKSANQKCYTFFIKIKCSNCGEETEKWHALTEEETTNEDSRNPKGVNFYMKCKLCSRENSIDILEGTNAAYTSDDSEKFKTIVCFDCRGVEPVKFSPRSGWIVKCTENGQIFEDVDLSEDDWVEYDEKNKQNVGVYSFESQFIKLKK